ncbi:GNAT family N-acetyltransferase [Streptomyces sp. NPDC058467]|uniref:GNAT family N-acetyltransferase n=1 Tax=Streptomyces sp. NPDC058467 TaxID=3346513 RepID=UPI00364E0F55
MEISAAGRLEVRITAADVGKRVSVRQQIEDAREGELFTDTVGVLTSWDDGVLLITRRTGERVRIAESALVAGKVVPAAPARRRGPAASYEELARVAARAWLPVQSERLGEWELRAASGFTRRANSVLPLGDPGVPLDEALTYVRDWYAARDLPAYIQTATGAEGTQEPLCAELEARGWAREVTAELWIGSLAPIADREAPEVVLSREADDAWLGRYQRKGLSEVALKVLGSGPSVWFATVPGPEGEPPAAIGRCVVDGRWAGFAAVEVAPAARRQGLATAVMASLARQALTEGASAAWLQVETENAEARAMYAGMGFGVHHTYHHYRWAAGPGDGSGNADTGRGDVDSAGTGSADTGSADTGSADAGSTDTGSADTGSADTGSADTGSADTGSADTGSADAGRASTGSTDAGRGNAGSTGTGSADTGSVGTGSTGTGSADAGRGNAAKAGDSGAGSGGAEAGVAGRSGGQALGRLIGGTGGPAGPTSERDGRSARSRRGESGPFGGDGSYRSV